MAALSLPGMPAEILGEIQSYLSYAPQIALRLACNELYHKLDNPNQIFIGTRSNISSPVQPTLKRYEMGDLLEIEMGPEYNSAQGRPEESRQPISGLESFACYLCCMIRCTSKFSNLMVKGKRKIRQRYCEG